MTPAARQVARLSAVRELVSLTLASGILFTLKAGYTHSGGSVAYGSQRWAYDLSEAITDGGVITKDRQLAAALRGLGLFTEVQL